MAAASHLDTLDYAKKLEAAGVPKAQAELQASALNDALAGSVVSRSDLSNLAQGIDGEFASLQAKIDARFQQVDARFDNVDARFDNVDARFDARFDNVDARFDAMLANVDSRFHNVDARFDAMLANVDARFDNVDLKLAHLESRVDARIGSVELKLGGKIETLQWMLGVIVAMNAAVLVQLFLK
ncbi:MAG TPA: coiled-coil domain-containing protein [Casimicrobiaceae bacterium]|nr:coiled-coil domain-containing protein [Casimicrobiaceae bacterium]